MSVLDGVELEVTDLARVAIAPGDVLVLRMPGRLTQEQTARIQVQLKDVWPDNRCVVIDGGATLSVVTPAGAE